MNAAADRVHLELRQVRGPHLKPTDVTDAFFRILRIPLAGDLCRVFLIEYRIEDWLLRKARRERLESGGSDQVKLFRTNGTIERRGFAHLSVSFYDGGG